jgi:hypothetical protein
MENRHPRRYLPSLVSRLRSILTYEVIADDRADSIFAIVEVHHNTDHIVVQTLGLVSLACVIMTIAFSAILVAGFSALLADLEAKNQSALAAMSSEATDIEDQQAVVVDLSDAVSSASNFVCLSFLMLTATISCSCSMPIEPIRFGGITMFSSPNQLPGSHGQFLYLSYQHSLTTLQVLRILHLLPAALHLD